MYKISKLIVTLVCASLITSCQSHSRATRSANVYNWDSDQVCHDQNDKAHMEGQQPATLSINNGDQVKIKHMRSKHFHLDVHKYGTQPSGCASNSPDNPFDNIPFDTHWYRRDF